MIDVSGHGVGPGLLSGMFKASFRSFYKKETSLNSIVNNLNRVLLGQRKKGMFITFGGLRFYEKNRIEFITAGHPPIIRINRHGHLEELKITQLPLLTLLHNEFKSDLINVESGDLFIIYSDGIIETTNKKGSVVNHYTQKIRLKRLVVGRLTSVVTNVNYVFLYALLHSGQLCHRYL